MLQEQFAGVIQVLIPLTVFIMMICLGTSLTLDSFKKVLTFPRAILTGIVGQIILMPAMAFGIAATLGNGNLILQIGLVLLAACPGGPLSNTFVYQGHGRVDLSVSLTAVNGFLALLTTPLIASLGIFIFAGKNTDIKLSLGQTILQVFMIAILPVMIGMAINYKFPKFALANQGKAKALSLIMLVLHLSLVLVVNFAIIIESLHTLFLPALLFCVLAMTLGYFSAMLMGLDRDIRFTIGIEVGLQNVVLAILIANVILKRPEFALFVFTYGLAALLIIFPWIYLHRRGSAILASGKSNSA
jgi:bile acid:Na+ symporter, BASS family